MLKKCTGASNSLGFLSLSLRPKESMASIQIYADSEQTVKVFCKGDCNKALGIKDGTAAFVDIDGKDETQVSVLH